LAGQWWFLVHLLRQNGRLLVRLEAVEATLAEGGSFLGPSQNGTHVHQEAEGLPVGSEAPQFSLSGLYGESLTLEALCSSGKTVMMLFTDPGCGPCNALLPEVGRWQEEHANKLSLSLVSRGEVEENKTKAQEHALKNVVLQNDWEVSESYQVRGTPSAVLISADGKIASPVAGGAEGIRGLLSYAVGERPQLPMQPHQPQAEGQPCPNCGKVHAAAPTMPAAREIGEPAPEVKLADLEGRTVELKDFRGQQTLVLFWNPGCGFCQQMLPEIKQWEENRPEGAPKLLFVSAGTEEANRDMKLSSKVVLDQQFAAGRAFGASGTPSAVLVDAEGRIASEVAVGAPAVLGLAGASRAES
jgi:thiol-disulfide isomerase/thioredoxin